MANYMYKRYSGSFVSHGGAVWRCDIFQEAAAPFDPIGELTFEGEDALTIEWDEHAKEEVVCGSSATLCIESPGDRTYTDLYTVEPGTIRLDVYRDGVLYWSGTLDPEFYEEPYEKARYYAVTLTFVDFGILERKKYALAGMQTLTQVVRYALGEIGLGALPLESYISTSFPDGKIVTLDSIKVRSDNFIDEDGKASDLSEVLKGILQPLALRMEQRAGKVYIYDLNALSQQESTRLIQWSGDASTLGVDKAANNVQVTFSPYANAKLMDGDAIEYGGKYSNRVFNLAKDNSACLYDYGEYYSYLRQFYCGVARDVNSMWPPQLNPYETDFTIFLGDTGRGLEYISPQAKYFHIEGVSGGETSEGVAWALYGGGSAYLYPNGVLDTNDRALLNAGKLSGGSVLSPAILRTKRVYLPPLPSAEAEKYWVRVQLKALIDPRYNPLSSEDNPTEGYVYKLDNYWVNDLDYNEHAAWVFLPVGITLYDDSGSALYHYDNSAVARSARSAVMDQNTWFGEWRQGPGGFGSAWLEYYKTEKQSEKSGLSGWSTNRQCIGRPDSPNRLHPEYTNNEWKKYESYDFTGRFKTMEDGEYMLYPPSGGWLEITVYDGVRGFEWGENCDFDNPYYWTRCEMWKKLRWALYQAPAVAIVHRDVSLAEAEEDDLEYSGYINRSAKDDIKIDTICGTVPETNPAARGAYYRTSTGKPLGKLTRAGVTDVPERLLIGTVYTQYAERHTKLSGEVALDDDSLSLYTEQNQGDLRFLKVADVQNCLADTSEATFIETGPDSYEAIEEVEE